MAMRKLAAGLALGALALVAGCRSTSNRVACCQPVVVGTAPVVRAAPAPCCNGALPAPAPCCNGAPYGGPPAQVVVPGQPPLGAQVPPPGYGRY
jgi:hypothetical protein